MSEPHAAAPAQTDPPRCPFPLVDILEVLGCLSEGGPGTEGADEMIRRLALKIHLRTGLSQADILEAIERLPRGEGLDGTTPAEPIDLGAYYSTASPAQQLAAEYIRAASLRDLSHVLKPLSELDRDGTTSRLWRWLWREFPLFRDVFSAGLSSAVGCDKKAGGRASNRAARRQNGTASGNPPAPPHQAPAAGVDPAPVGENAASRREQKSAGGNKSTKRGTVNQRMLEKIDANPEALLWTVTQWTDQLRCGRATVHKAEAYKKCRRAQERVKRERAERERGW
jgi:hypothetical protein